MAIRVVDADVIGSAIVATEKEIAGEAWGLEESVEDETGDRTLETMGEGLEGQHEPDDDDEETEDEESEVDEESDDGEEGEKEPTRDDKGKFAKDESEKDKAAAKDPETEREGRVPSGKLREANDRARAAEAERETLKTQLETERASTRGEIDALKRSIEQLSASLRQPPKPAGEADKTAAPPDFFEDPNGFIAHQTKPLLDTVSQLRNDLAAQRVETSMAMAHSKHGDGFAKAYEAVTRLNPQNTDDQVTVRRIYASPNPGEALVAWHKRNETLRQVGDDPSAYTERIRNETRESLMKDPEFRKQLIESLRADASTGDDGKPRTTLRLPKSLNGAAGGNSGRGVDRYESDDSDQSVADSAWR